MLGYLAVPLGILIIFFVIFFEVIRSKERKIDFLTGVNLIYLITFGIVPIFAYFFSDYTTWNTLRESDLNRTSYLFASLYSIIGYLSIVSAYYFGGKLKFINKQNLSKRLFENISDRALVFSAFSLFFVGFLSMIIYINVIGGLHNYLTLGPLLRSGSSLFSSPFMFFKNVAPLMYPASFLFYVIFIQSKSNLNKLFYLTIFIFTFTLSVLHLYHAAGRMAIFTYFLTFPLCHIIYRGRVKKRFVIGTALFGFFIIVFGDELTNFYSTKTFSQILNNSIGNMGMTLGSVIQEFSFPYTNASHNVSIFPVQYDFRYGFMDVLVGLNEIIPTRLLPKIEGESITSFNTQQIGGGSGTVPIDFVSFGYASFGVAGVVITGLLFGLLMKFIESIFSYKPSFTSAMLFSAWFMFVSFRFMYADPGHVFDGAFRLVIATLLVIVLSKFYTPRHSMQHK